MVFAKSLYKSISQSHHKIKLCSLMLLIRLLMINQERKGNADRYIRQKYTHRSE